MLDFHASHSSKALLLLSCQVAPLAGSLRPFGWIRSGPTVRCAMAPAWTTSTVFFCIFALGVGRGSGLPVVATPSVLLRRSVGGELLGEMESYSVEKVLVMWGGVGRRPVVRPATPSCEHRLLGCLQDQSLERVGRESSFAALATLEAEAWIIPERAGLGDRLAGFGIGRGVLILLLPLSHS
jgi:hypothetical protein